MISESLAFVPLSRATKIRSRSEPPSQASTVSSSPSSTSALPSRSGSTLETASPADAENFALKPFETVCCFQKERLGRQSITMTNSSKAHGGTREAVHRMVSVESATPQSPQQTLPRQSTSMVRTTAANPPSASSSRSALDAT